MPGKLSINEILLPNSTCFREIRTPEDNGDVIQRFETFDTETSAWKAVFEARYVRVESGTQKRQTAPSIGPDISRSASLESSSNSHLK